MVFNHLECMITCFASLTGQPEPTRHWSGVKHGRSYLQAGVHFDAGEDALLSQHIHKGGPISGTLIQSLLQMRTQRVNHGYCQAKKQYVLMIGRSRAWCQQVASNMMQPEMYWPKPGAE